MKNYLNELKIAVINEDIDKLKKLINETPECDTVEEAQEIVAFLQQAIKLLQKEKDKLSTEMQKIKNIQKYNQSKKQNSFEFKI